ncbi:MAG: hypothetical protein WA908_11575 [Pontixanthobacter sp.]
MRENLDQMPFVIACYAVAVLATLALAGWSWWTMCEAERRRDRMRRK